MTLVLAVGLLAGCGRWRPTPAIYVAKDAAALENFAAAELRRYMYLATGELAAVVKIDSVRDLKRPGVILSRNGKLLQSGAAHKSEVEKVPPEISIKLGPEDYRLKTLLRNDRRYLLISYGEGAGVLYGTYAFIETLGVRFYLDGDVVPDEKTKFEIPELDETARPLFALRGIQPFHDFAEGPDWWDEDAYKAVLGQLPKLRMNFFGLHTYPEKNPNAEPTVWIGLPGDFVEDGRVSFAYPSSYQNTMRANPWSHNWGYQPKKTGDFHFGAGELFKRDAYGAKVMDGVMPEPKTPKESNDLFNRTAAMLRGAFTFGRKLGVRTCVGTETPLVVPALVQERLKKKTLDPGDPKVVKELYKGIFQRIAASYPLDYYWPPRPDKAASVTGQSRCGKGSSASTGSSGGP